MFTSNLDVSIGDTERWVGANCRPNVQILTSEILNLYNSSLCSFLTQKIGHLKGIYSYFLCTNNLCPFHSQKISRLEGGIYSLLMYQHLVPMSFPKKIGGLEGGIYILLMYQDFVPFVPILFPKKLVI